MLTNHLPPQSLVKWSKSWIYSGYFSRSNEMIAGRYWILALHKNPVSKPNSKLGNRGTNQG